MTARTDTARLLALIPYLRSHPGVAVTEVARVFGVTTDRVIADLKILWMVGLPGGMPDDLIDIDMDAVDSDGTITITNADAGRSQRGGRLRSAFGMVHRSLRQQVAHRDRPQARR